MNFIIRSIPDFILFFQSLSVWVQFNILFFNSIFLYYSLKWVLFDPQGTGQSFGRWLLRRILIAIAINIQLYFWFSPIVCADIGEKLVDDKYLTPTMKYILVGASTVFLTYCIYKACSSFVHKTYPSYMDKERTRIMDAKYEICLRESQARFQEEQAQLMANYEEKALASHKFILSQEQLEELRVQMNLQKEEIAKCANELRSGLDQHIYRLSNYDEGFRYLMKSTHYKTKVSNLSHPEYTAIDYLKDMVSNLQTLMMKLNGNLGNKVTIMDLKVYYGYFGYLVDNLRTDINRLSVLDRVRPEELGAYHAKFDHLNNMLRLMSSDNFRNRMEGLYNAGIMNNTIVHPELDYAEVHWAMPTLARVIPPYGYKPFTAPDKADIPFSFVEVSLPILYDLGIVGSYGVLSVCSAMFGVYNPITFEIFQYSWGNLFKNIVNLFSKK